MKVKNFALAAVLTVSGLSAMHADLAGKTLGQINGLYERAVGRAMPAGHNASYDNTAHQLVAHGAVVAQAHHAALAAETEAMLRAVGKAVGTPEATAVVARKLNNILLSINAWVDVLSGGNDAQNILDGAAARFTGTLHGVAVDADHPAVAGRTAGQLKAFFATEIGRIATVAGAPGALHELTFAPPASSKLAVLNASEGAVDIELGRYGAVLAALLVDPAGAANNAVLAAVVANSAQAGIAGPLGAVAHPLTAPQIATKTLADRTAAQFVRVITEFFAEGAAE